MLNMNNELNIYDLLRNWWNHSFDNPEKVKPNHHAIYTFAIEHCNRLGWKYKYGFPTTMVMDAVGIKSYKTYINCLNDIVDWGFIDMVEKSKNQYSANIIALVNFTKANTKADTKALDKALLKHVSKQVQSTHQSNDSVDIQIYNNTNIPIYKDTSTQVELYPTFNDFWELYDKKIDRKRVEQKWNKLKQKEKEKVMEYIPAYKESQPDKQYIKNPDTFLNNKAWENEIINKYGNESELRENISQLTISSTDF